VGVAGGRIELVIRTIPAKHRRKGVMAFIDKTIEIPADVREVYEAWTAFADYPKFMETITTVVVAPDDRLHWVALVEEDTIEWDADVIERTPDEGVKWRATDGRETGEVRFEKLATGLTKVTYQLEYDPASWEGKPDTVRHWMRRRVDRDLDQFRKMVEAAG
jgi:uncharacterized membrane protein